MTAELEAAVPIPLIRSFARFLWPSLLLALGLIVTLLPCLYNGTFPGDDIDARFNNIVLEHVYRWCRGLEPSLWSPGYYFPFQNVLAFSDNLFGSMPVYGLLRYLGLDRWGAYQGWWAISFVLNFIACHVAMTRIGFRAIAGAFGAFVFCFALPVFGNKLHAQLAYRCGIPIAVGALYEFDSSGGLRRLGWFSAALVWQFFCTIYLGVFLSMMIMVALIVLAVTGRDRAGFIRYWPIRLASAWRLATGYERWATVLVMVGSALALGLLLYPYWQVTQDYGLHHDWSEISDTLPRPWSYLRSDYTHIWHLAASLLPRPPQRWAHQLFIGAIPIYLMVKAFLGPTGTRHRRLVTSSGLTLLVLVLLTLSVDDRSLYELLVDLPGASAIRIVSRVIFVMLMPIAILSAVGVETILDSAAGELAATGRVLVLLVGALVEVGSIHHWTRDLKSWQARIDTLQSRLPRTLPARPILYVPYVPGRPLGLDELDAMMLAQEQGWNTVVGYSGNLPPGYDRPQQCADGEKLLANYFEFRGLPLGEAYLDERSRLVPVCP